MILVKRTSYDKWETADGEVLWGSKRYTSLPYIRYLVEYCKTGAVIGVKQWSKKAHDIFYGPCVTYKPDIRDYANHTKELAVYMSLLLPERMIWARSTIPSKVKDPPTGVVDPAILALHTTNGMLIREARILFELRQAMIRHQRPWIAQQELAPVMIQALKADWQRLISEGVIVRKGNYVANATLLDEDVAPPHSLQQQTNKVSTTGQPQRIQVIGDVARLTEVLMEDTTRVLLTVTESGSLAILPPKKLIVRFVANHHPFKANEIVTLSWMDPMRYFVQSASNTKNELVLPTSLLYDWTNPAASATFDDLLHIPSTVIGYTHIVVIGDLQPHYLRECTRILNGHSEKIIIVDFSKSSQLAGIDK